MDDGVILVSNTKRQIYIVHLDFNAKGFNNTWLSYIHRVASVYVGYYQERYLFEVLYVESIKCKCYWRLCLMEQLYTVEPV